jgi:hypothetical protein
MGRYSTRYEKTSEVFGYLSEPQSTNDFDYSEDLTQWTLNEVTIDTIGIIAPDDSKIMQGIIANVNNTQHYIGKVLTPVDNLIHIFSAFVKKGTQDWCYLRSELAGPLIITQWFDLVNGVIGTSSGTILSKGIEDWGNGYYRIWMEYDGPVAAHTHRIGAAEADNDDTFSDSSGLTALYIWGLQHEKEIEYVSSYIPTVGAAATRVADTMLFEAAENIGGASAQQARIQTNILCPNYDNINELTIAHIDQDPLLVFNNISCFVNSTNNPAIRTRSLGGDPGDTSSSENITNGIKQTTNFRWENDNVRVNNGPIDTSADIPVNLEKLFIGSDEDQLFQLNGIIENFKIYEK